VEELLKSYYRNGGKRGTSFTLSQERGKGGRALEESLRHRVPRRRRKKEKGRRKGEEFSHYYPKGGKGGGEKGGGGGWLSCYLP